MNDITITYKEFKDVWLPLREATSKIAIIENQERILPNEVLDGLKESLEAMKVILDRFIKEN